MLYPRRRKKHDIKAQNPDKAFAFQSLINQLNRYLR
jgi:hypothetical protein